MTLTAGQLAPLAASAKTEIDRVIALASPTTQEITDSQAVGFDYSAVAYATLGEILNAKQGGYDMGIATFDDLDIHLQVYVDNSALLSEDNRQRLRWLTMPARIRAVAADNIQYFNTSQSITIPDNCYLIKISFQAAGGNSGESQRGTSWNFAFSGGGGGGGGSVFEYEMAVTPNSIITLTKGDTMTFGALTVEQGGIGDNYKQYSGAFIKGGVGGRVLWNGVSVDDGVTAIAGGVGGRGAAPILDVNTMRAYDAAFVSTTNGKTTGSGSGYYSKNSKNHQNGNGGGACASNNGLDGLQGNDNLVETRTPPIGTGAPSPVSYYSGGVDLINQGGVQSSTVIINFTQQSA